MLEGADKRVLETKLYLFEIFIKEITEIAKYDDITEEKNSKEKSLNYLENFIQNLSEEEKEKIKVLEEEIKVLEEKEKNFNLKEFVQRKILTLNKTTFILLLIVFLSCQMNIDITIQILMKYLQPKDYYLI